MPARDHCGVVGVSLQGKGAAPYLFRGLRALQHRGQESSGIATTSHGVLHHRKGMGLVHEIFTQEMLDSLRGSTGIGHVRYPTTGSTDLENAQPIVFKVREQDAALAANGDLVNYERIRRRIQIQGVELLGNADTETIAQAIALEFNVTRDLDSAIRRACPELIGGYAVVMIVGNRIVRVPRPARDPPPRLRDGRGRRRGRERIRRARAHGRQVRSGRAARRGRRAREGPARADLADAEFGRTGALHVRMGLLLPAGLDRRERPDLRCPAPHWHASRERGAGRGRHCRSRPRFRPSASAGLLRGVEDPLRRSPDQEPVRRADLHPSGPEATGVGGSREAPSGPRSFERQTRSSCSTTPSSEERRSARSWGWSAARGRPA